MRVVTRGVVEPRRAGGGCARSMTSQASVPPWSRRAARGHPGCGAALSSPSVPPRHCRPLAPRVAAPSPPRCGTAAILELAVTAARGADQVISGISMVSLVVGAVQVGGPAWRFSVARDNLTQDLRPDISRPRVGFRRPLRCSTPAGVPPTPGRRRHRRGDPGDIFVAIALAHRHKPMRGKPPDPLLSSSMVSATRWAWRCGRG